MGRRPASDEPPPTSAPGKGTGREEHTASYRLNVFALPTRTTLLFVLIVGVVLLPFAASLIGETPLCGGPTLALILVLSLYRFLRAPERERAAFGMKNLAPDFPELAACIEREATARGLRRPVRLLQAPDMSRVALHTFGSFTRHFLVVPRARAALLERALRSPEEQKRETARATILHELSHFVNGDVGPVYFSRNLLTVAVIVPLLNYLVFALAPWLYETVVGMMDLAAVVPPEVQALLAAVDREVASALVNPPVVEARAWLRFEAYALSAHGPLIVGGLILLLFYWRALLRTRELYADARVVQWQGASTYLRAALREETVVRRLHPARAPTSWGRLANRIPSWRQLLPDILVDRPRQALINWAPVRSLRAALALHPSGESRRACLCWPERVYGSPVVIATTAGLTVVLLNLTSYSLFLSRFIRGPNAFLPFVLGFVLLSLSLLPALCAFREEQRQWRRVIVRVVAIFTGIKLVPQLIAALVVIAVVLGAPALIGESLAVLLGIGTGDAPAVDVSAALMLQIYVVGPAILFVVGMPLTLILFLELDTRLKRRALTWYGAARLWRHPVLFFWGTTLWLGAVLGFVLLPIYNVAAVPTAHSLREPLVLSQMLVTLAGSAVIVVALAALDRRYHARCPTCGGPAPGEYHLGATCPSESCGVRLHPWLLDEAPTLESECLDLLEKGA